MQSRFLKYIDKEKKSDLIADVVHEVKAARKNEERIILVELSRKYNGKTSNSIVDALIGYHYYVVEKSGMDGSGVIHYLADVQNDPHVSFRVCGIFTDQCVAETVIGLRKHFPKAPISVVSKACASDSGSGPIQFKTSFRAPKKRNMKSIGFLKM
jgi:hypothetical protein